MSTMTYRPIKQTYTMWTTPGLGDDDDVDVSVFTTTVRFTAPKQPDVHIDTGVWNDWGKPRRILVTLAPVTA